MKILICYASTEGQTRKIARFCANQLFARGHSVELLPVSDADPINLAEFDAAILAGSVHTGEIQSELADFVTQRGEKLNTMPTVYLQVSLAAAGSDVSDQTDLARIAAEFCGKAGWAPGETHQIAGAFQFSRYDFFKSLAMRYIASQYGQEIDPHSDTEYTDWAALAELLKGWPDLKDGPA